MTDRHREPGEAPRRRLAGWSDREYRTVQYKGFDLAGYGSVDTPFGSRFIVLAFHYGIGLGF